MSESQPAGLRGGAGWWWHASRGGAQTLAKRVFGAAENDLEIISGVQQDRPARRRSSPISEEIEAIIGLDTK